ncbi:MAG: hypothetical protein IJ057_05105 [Bacteroidales bacterium]|nr:hypothetical protein [Bacteroidales bacterium]
MRNKVLSYIAIAVMFFSPLFLNHSKAQVFIMDDEEFSRLGREESELPNIPWLGQNYDQYAPLNGEVLLLSCLGGAFLLHKCKKSKE